MAFTGAVALTGQLVGMTIAGIASTSMFAYPPDITNSVAMPIFYVRLATISREMSSFTYEQGLKNGVFECVVLIGEMLLDTQANNIAKGAALEDAISTALEANAATLGLDSYTITPDEDTIGGTAPMWALIIRGEVSG